MTKSRKRHREYTEVATTKLKPEHHEAYLAAAEYSGLPPGTFLRNLVLDAIGQPHQYGWSKEAAQILDRIDAKAAEVAEVVVTSIEVTFAMMQASAERTPVNPDQMWSKSQDIAVDRIKGILFRRQKRLGSVEQVKEKA
jgi:hypothetical protein